MAGEDAQREIARLTTEVERLRAIERSLREERERVRQETAAELSRLQLALREAASRAAHGEGGAELAVRTQAAADAGRHLAEREAQVAVAERRVRDLEERLAGERDRLAAEREYVEAQEKRLAREETRLLRESERLAEWERQALAGAPPAQVAVGFDEGLRRLADGAAGRSRSPSGGSW